MTLRDLLKKKEKIANGGAQPVILPPPPQDLAVPDFKFVRSTTDLEEVIHPPDEEPPASRSKGDIKDFLHLRRSSKTKAKGLQGCDPADGHGSDTAGDTAGSRASSPGKGERKLSGKLDRLHLGSHSRKTSGSSIHVPDDLPDVPGVGTEPTDEAAALWEQRATLLARSGNSRPGTSRSATPERTLLHDGSLDPAHGERPAHERRASDAEGDSTIQKAIDLHEVGELERSTAMFGRLAAPDGANNALAQVLYGLALRHGWGVPADAPRALEYLHAAAANAAQVETAALATGVAGGSAKGELVLAIYELANSFRHGWGVARDPVAARRYYETAANLGDADAMLEAARCFEDGTGGAKSRFAAAQYYRMAERRGNKIVGNSWIWKDKYDPKPA